MTRMTALQISQLNRMNEAARKAGLGTRLDEVEYGTVVDPDVGSVEALSVISYVVAPDLQTATYVHAATLLTTGIQTISTAITNPDVPRILTVKGNDGNVTGNVVFTGTDFDDNVLTETIALSGSSEVVGTKAFKTVTSYTIPVYAVAGTETVSVGVGVKLGLPVAIPGIASVIAHNFNGAVDAGTVTTGGTLPTSIYAVAGTMDGTIEVQLIFIA